MKVKVVHGGIRMIEIISDNNQTNADRIRSMSDEELAKFIIGQRYCDVDENSEKVFLDWLQRQVG